MKTWKQYPQLFANGKFKLKYPEYHNPVTFNSYWYHNLHLEIDVCTLIARRIEGMTDEEYLEMYKEDYPENLDVNKRAFKMQIELDCLSADQLIYLLSVGICPPQFWDDSVIDINEVEK